MELASPITIYWDLPGEEVDDAWLERICAGIAACRPLMLQLRTPCPGGGAATRAVLNRFRAERVALHLTIPLGTPSALPDELLREPGLKELLVAVDQPEELSFLGAVQREPGGARLGVACTVNDGNWRRLPRLFARCREMGITRVVLPMQRRYQGAPPFRLGREEQRLLARETSAAGGVQGLDLTVHDPFLWRALYPGVPFPQGGCQAANTMLAIAPDGRVYPCPTLPLALGDAGVTPLGDIASSAAKKQCRSFIKAEPSGCHGCAELPECRGGCRGRALTPAGTLEQADPACR